MTVTSPSAANGHVPGSPYAFSTAANTAFSEEAALSLTNINDINRFLHETVAKERSIDAELEQLLTRRTEVEKSILALHTASSEMLGLIKVDAEQLLSSVKTTADLADGVSSKVRELDLAQNRVHDTMRRIHMVVDRSSCIDGVRDALSEGDLERAAQCVARFLELEEATRDIADASSTQAQEQRQVLEEARRTLEDIVRQRYQDAARTRDHANLLRHLRLYKPLQLAAEGQAAFQQYVQELLAERAAADYDVLMDSFAKGEQPDFVKTLSNLLTTVVAAADENLQLLQDTFGDAGTTACILAWHEQCERDACKILQRFVSHRQLQQLVKDVGAAHRPGGGGAAGGEGPDPRTVEDYLEELLLLCQAAEEYFQILTDRIPSGNSPTTAPGRGDGGQGATSAAQGVTSPRALAAAGGGGTSSTTTSGEHTLRTGQLHSLVRELCSYYISLEEFYMEESVSKAMRIDEFVQGSLTTTMVDDVFFILQKCSRRALASGRVMSIAAVFSHCNILLSSVYKEALMMKLQGAAARLLQSATHDGDHDTLAAGRTSALHAAPFNNAEMSAVYVTRLRTQLEELVVQLFQGPVDREKVKSVLADLGKTSTDFRGLATKALDTLCGGVMPRLRHVLDAMASVGYELNEAEYAENEVADTWVQQLLRGLQVSLHWLQPLLTPGNYETLFHLVLDKVVSRLEALMLAKRFNQLGGLQLDRDVRVLVAQLSDITQRTVRDKFARLTQMASVLSLERAQEILDYWGDNSGAITWRLTEADVRQVLSQRVDFSRQEIVQIPL